MPQNNSCAAVPGVSLGRHVLMLFLLIKIHINSMVATGGCGYGSAVWMPKLSRSVCWRSTLASPAGPTSHMGPLHPSLSWVSCLSRNEKGLFCPPYGELQKLPSCVCSAC